MTKPAVNLKDSKSKGQIFFEYALGALCLCVIALRATITEGPVMPLGTGAVNFSNITYSLIMSALLIFVFILWFVRAFWSGKFLYRVTGIEAGLALFMIAGAISYFSASNKRLAINDISVSVAPILMAVFLVQILDTPAKIKVLLCVVGAFGIVCAYQCAEQFFVSNQLLIEQYQQNPDIFLKHLAIEPGSFQHKLFFEHRLFSKDVRSFFTTSNSAGSFAVLASFAAAATVLGRLKKNKSINSLGIITGCIGVVIVVLGLFLTQSKGAIAAWIIAVAMLITYLKFGNWLKKHRISLLIICLILFLAGVGVIVGYGLKYDRLPGGNSMLVRWQYWRASVQMYTDNFLTGIGPGNYKHFYTHYKPAAASEIVSNPHNFLLKILTQYGPLGLLGFLAAFIVPLYKVVFCKTGSDFGNPVESRESFKSLAIGSFAVISVVMLFIRPVLSPIDAGGDIAVLIYTAFTLYIVAFIAFALGFWLLTKNQITSKSPGSNITSAILVCGILGFLLHNCIDFAFFEPGVSTIFWALIACMVAANYQHKGKHLSCSINCITTRALIAVATLSIGSAFVYYAIVPAVRANGKIKAAMANSFDANHLLEQAAKIDRLDPVPLSWNGKLYLQQYAQMPNESKKLLEEAQRCYAAAIERDKADYANYQKLSGVYNLLGQYQNAYDQLAEAAKRYPGSGKIQFELGRLAEWLGKIDKALEHYKNSVEIEDAYRQQFQVMYPGEKIFSRLGQENYDLAKKLIKQLKE